MHSLLSHTVSWALNQHSSHHHDDVLLAMVSPEAFWLLREWQRRTFGDQEALRRVLDAARNQLTAAADSGSEPALRGARVTVRTKGLWSTFHKAGVRQQKVHDVLALRLVLPESEQAFFTDDDASPPDGPVEEEASLLALDAIRRMWPSVGGRFKNYVRSPKPNGYAAMHDTVRLPCGSLMEVQIRSVRAHREAEHGKAAHRRYKGAMGMLPSTMLSSIISLAPTASRAAAAQQPTYWLLRQPAFSRLPAFSA